MSRPAPRTILALALVVLVVGGVAAAWLVPPLGTGHGGVAFGPPDVDLTTDSQTGAAMITYRPLGQVGWGVEVRNTTFLPVTIDGLTDGPQPYPIAIRLVLGTDPNNLGLQEDHVRAFAPITLAPGETQLIGVLGTFPDCADARPNWTTGTGATISTLRLDVRVAGILPVGAEVPLLESVELSGDSDAACP